MSTPTYPAPQIDGNQGVFFYSNWFARYDTSSAGADTFDIEYEHLVPSSHGTPNILITSASIQTFGVQELGGGSSFLKLEREDSDETAWWKMLCTVYDGQYSRQQNHVPGIRMTPEQLLCFQAFWKAYTAGYNLIGSPSTTQRIINVQVVYTLES